MIVQFYFDVHRSGLYGTPFENLCGFGFIDPLQSIYRSIISEETSARLVWLGGDITVTNEYRARVLLNLASSTYFRDFSLLGLALERSSPLQMNLEPQSY
ncbi:unnamed protein product [Calypogeia fissa]